jgi:hypothetical protein
MPKQYHVINDFSGGMNTRKDPRDLRDNESSYIQNMSINDLGKIRTMGMLFNHNRNQDGSTNFSEYIPLVSVSLAGSGGYGLFYFESDHSSAPEETIIKTETGGADLALGTGNGEISFNRVYTYTDEKGIYPESGGGD